MKIDEKPERAPGTRRTREQSTPSPEICCDQPVAGRVVAGRSPERRLAAEPHDGRRLRRGHALGDLDRIERNELARPGRQLLQPEDRVHRQGTDAEDLAACVRCRSARR